ncbi:hypothetical protein Pint_01294 [Pistacia integerrima]|uniref:Uncharacterized protein n=1 Tax=Pistacia integerrima TaxID=434235 RepID=A0ACC0ZI29_9ROSI|nr:hypothetical protein Pint_01294 [Pistacia integerrima]
MTIVEMRVHMDCAGCESKIKKALQKLDGVDDIDIDIATQKVTVMGWAEQKKVLKTVRKTGRRAELWPYPYNPEYHNYYYQQQHQHQNYYYQNQVEVEAAATVSHQYHSSQHLPSTSSYNYKEHGYTANGYGYYQPAPYSHIIDDRASALFSDDNPNACSIM